MAGGATCSRRSAPTRCSPCCGPPRVEGLANARACVDRCRRDDLAPAVAQTDVKGDRSLGPSQQAAPDLYLRIVDSDADSITVRETKTHTSFSADADEIVVPPTRATGPGDADWAVSFAVPVDTPELSRHVSAYLPGELDGFGLPIPSRHKLLGSLTVFDDVPIPRDRVFRDRRPELAGSSRTSPTGMSSAAAIRPITPDVDHARLRRTVRRVQTNTTPGGDDGSTTQHVVSGSLVVRLASRGAEQEGTRCESGTAPQR
ncbi:4-hydroxyphenylacetate 3-monooxygenase [Pseudonocardia sp. N23]|nr:4-hydroxyphenylacetate 3-monooxygenase [Pseudonocardia sp. N23]